jgi:hypothetical protein
MNNSEQKEQSFCAFKRLSRFVLRLSGVHCLTCLGRSDCYIVESKLRLLRIRSVLVKLLRRLQIPATESQLAITLAVSLVMMAAMLLGILWQANVINFQKELIRALWNSKFAG